MNEKNLKTLSGVWRWFMAALGIDCVLIPLVDFSERGEIILLPLCSLIAIAALILFFRLIYIYWSLIPAEDRWIGPDAALLLLLVPWLNILWYGILVIRLSLSFDRAAGDERFYCLPIAIAHVTLFATIILFFRFDLSSGIILAVLFAVMLFQMQRAAKSILRRSDRLEKLPGGGCMITVMIIVLAAYVLCIAFEIIHNFGRSGRRGDSRPAMTEQRRFPADHSAEPAYPSEPEL